MARNAKLIMNDSALLEKAIDLLGELVAFDTTSSRSNLELIGFVRDYLFSFGINSTLVYNDSGDKANLYATIGGTDRPGICLSGHTDVVPVAGQTWRVEPFRLTREGELLFGRGVADMKGFLAAALATIPVFLTQVRDLPVHLSFSYDEEVGCLGIRRLLAELEHMPVRPLGCIIGEPTAMRVVSTHKGKRSYRCHIRGLAGHSALTHSGVNAVEFGADLVAFLRRTATELASNGPRDDRFVPPYSTVHTGRFTGGTILNIIPDQAEFDFEIRHLPDDDANAIVARIRSHAARLCDEMQTRWPAAAIEWQELSAYPALRDEKRSEWLKECICQLTGNKHECTMSFGTEGGLFQRFGVPTVVCGPGSIEQAHKADEYIEVGQLEQCLTLLSTMQSALREQLVRSGHRL